MSLVFHLTGKQETELLGPQGHSFFKLLFIEQGEGSHQIGCRRVGAVPGDLLLIAPDEIHDPSGLEGTRRWVVAFGADT